MRFLRQLIIVFVVFAISQPVFAQCRLNLTVPPEQLVPPASQQPVSAAMHPAAKGALIGAAAGAAFVGAVGLWYCTIGPNEVGECENPRWLWKGLAIYGTAGAGIGALIGAIVDRR
jgi:hypothetical protein